MRALATLAVVAAAAACSGGAPAPERPGAASSDAVEKPIDRCLAAQEVELEAWLGEMVAVPGDEVETWATVSMILTVTDPEILEEIRLTSPEATEAVSRSEETWHLCRGLLSVNCASFERAMELTEARLEPGLFDRPAARQRCRAGEISEDMADCALAAVDSETARTCW